MSDQPTPPVHQVIKTKSVMKAILKVIKRVCDLAYQPKYLIITHR